MAEGKRIALVIGNAEYEHADPLSAPVDHDAIPMAEALKRLNFDVQLGTNCDINEFHQKLRNFKDSFDDSTTALFYYSGHAVQHDGDMYLIPVDARIKDEDDLDELAFQVSRRLKLMHSSVAVSLLFLDACREKPFTLDKGGPRTKRVVIEQSKLKEQITAPASNDALIAYAADPGETAVDGEEGQPSPFTKALLDHIEQPGLEIKDMMTQVTSSLRIATKGRQNPWIQISLVKKFYFQPTAVTLDEGTAQRQDIGSPPAVDPATESRAATPPANPREPNAEAERPAEAKSVKTTDREVGQEAKAPVSPWDRMVRFSGLNLTAGIESTARNAGPLILGGASLAIAFMLMLLSERLSLAWVKYPIEGGDKQVGFIAALNWSFVYGVLFPLYLCLFADFTNRNRIALATLARQGIVVDARGKPVTEPMLSEAWNAAMQKASILLWILLFFIAVQTSSEWYGTCVSPYLPGFEGKITVDWSTLAAAQGRSATKSVIFSGIAYLYMAVALYIYLAILVYVTAFCVFLNSLADPTGEFRMVMRDSTISDHFAVIGTLIFWCTILGLGAGLMMRLQAIYLSKHYLVVTELLFSDLLSMTGRLSPIADKLIPNAGEVPSAWTGLYEMLFTLLCLFTSFFFLHNAFQKARSNYLDKDMRKAMKIDSDPKIIAVVAKSSFLKDVFPTYFHLAVIVTGVTASGFFIGYGSILVATVAYAVLTLVILPSRGTQDVRDTDASDEPSP